MPPLPIGPAVLLAAIVESSDDAICSKDLDGTITSWNRAAERMFGYSAEEAIGQSIRLIIPADRQSEEDHVLSRIRRGETVGHFETVRRRKMALSCRSRFRCRRFARPTAE
jgi:PAS domain S-box-containing protein